MVKPSRALAPCIWRLSSFFCAYLIAFWCNRPERCDVNMIRTNKTQTQTSLNISSCSKRSSGNLCEEDAEQALQRARISPYRRALHDPAALHLTINNMGFRTRSAEVEGDIYEQGAHAENPIPDSEEKRFAAKGTTCVGMSRSPSHGWPSCPEKGTKSTTLT
jgi:hypothetical protein